VLNRVVSPRVQLLRGMRGRGGVAELMLNEGGLWEKGRGGEKGNNWNVEVTST